MRSLIMVFFSAISQSKIYTEAFASSSKTIFKPTLIGKIEQKCRINQHEAKTKGNNEETLKTVSVK